MRIEPLDVAIHSETLLAVVLGAVLATVSGLVATQFESHLRRREREHDAALFFGELLSAIRILIERVNDSKQLGDPYGGITMRMLRAARREVDIYDRNRESLYDLRGATLRFQIQSLMIRIALALDGVFDCTEALAGLSDPDPRRGPLLEGRERSFGFLLANASEIGSLLALLARPAGQTFDLRIE